MVRDHLFAPSRLSNSLRREATWPQSSTNSRRSAGFSRISTRTLCTHLKQQTRRRDARAHGRRGRRPSLNSVRIHTGLPGPFLSIAQVLVRQ